MLTHLSMVSPSFLEYVSDFTTAGCYYAIPIQLLYFLFYNPVPLPWRYRLIIVLFAAFILLCGSSHLIMVLLADHTVTSELALPAMKALTAVVSIATVFVLLYLIPEGLKFILYSLDLEVQMRHRMTELDEANKQALQANLNKSEFMAFLCHEIRNPLHIIAANADFLMETRTTEEQREFIRSVNDSAQLMTSIVNDVLDLQRLQSGRMSFERIPVDLRDVCQSLIKNVKHQAVNKRVQLLFEWEPGTPRHVISDPTRLHQLLLNLTSNAIKFTQEGNVTVRVSLLSAAAQAEMFPVLASTSSASLHELSKKKRVHMEDDEDDMQPTQSLLRQSSSSSSTPNMSTSSSSAATTPTTTPTTALRTVHQFPVRSISGQTIAMNFAASTQQTENERFIHDAEEEAYEHEVLDNDDDDLLSVSPRSAFSPRNSKRKRARQTQYICFTVKDTGMGISPHALPQLFSPYTQAKLSIVREKGGTGLGLSICREIISNLHGQIKVHSELGQGSEFQFVLRMAMSSEKEWLKAQHDNYHVNERHQDEEKLSSLQRTVSHARGTSIAGEQLIMPASKELMTNTSTILPSLKSPTSLTPHQSVSRHSPSSGPRALSPSSSSSSEFSTLPATSPLSRLRSLANKPPALDTVDSSSVYKPTNSKSPSPMSPRVNLTPSVPLTPSSSASSTSSNSSGSTTPVARSILVADDNDVNRKILSRILTSLRYRPVMANDGVQAVEAIKTNMAAGGPPFMCVFMDISMPHLDGYEATRHIRALGCRVPIIALTANALSEERKKALEAGMDAFQTKPIRKVELQKLLNKIDAEHNGASSTASSTTSSTSNSTSTSQPASQRSSLVAVAEQRKSSSTPATPYMQHTNVSSADGRRDGERRAEGLVEPGQHAIAIHG